MAEPYKINVETKAQLDEIQKLVEELRAINTEISLINGQSFSAISMSAAALSKTSKDLLVATLANRKAFGYMSGAADKASISSRRFQDETRKTRGEVDAFSSTLQGAYMEVGAMGTRLATQLPAAIKTTIQAFGRQEMAVQKVASAIRSQGGVVSEVLPIMQSLASEIQSITTYGDEQVLEMQSLAAAMGVASDQMAETIQNAIGLSSALGMDVMTATKAASAAIQGKTTALQEYIPSLIKCKSEAEKLATVQRLAAGGFEQARDRVDTLDGKLKQAANAWGDLQEVVGEAFAPAVKNVAGLLGGLCEILTFFPTVTKALTISLTSLAVGFAFTKVGGLLKVADSFVGLAGGVRTTTAAMHGLNAACRANPLGLVASAASLAIMAISSLAEYASKLSDAEDKEAEKRQAAYEARRRELAELRKAAGIVADYEAELKKANATAAETADSIERLSSEIAALESAESNGAGNAVENAKRLVDKKRELVELQKRYVESVRAAAEAELAFASNRETERKYAVEKDLDAARKAGLTHAVKFKEAELAYVEQLRQAADIQKKYYADHAHLVESEEDRVRIMAEAKSYAEMRLGQMRNEADAEKWLAAETAASKTRQQGLETDILRARASGNETLAKELEGSQRVAQLASEIFENARREGMSRDELVNLQNSANAQARERYNLEKSISDEAERQNAAKDAQTKIEDILLENKIEQLKAQGKMAEAQALERESQMQRKLDSMQGVSDEDKEKLRATMRQTYAYKDAQREQAASGLNSVQNFRRSPAGNGADVSSALARKNSMMAGGGFGGGFGSAGGSSRQNGRPATVSAKYGDLYDQWKASGGSKSGQSWTAFRDANKDTLNAHAQGRQTAGERKMSNDAQSWVAKNSATARRVSGAPQGVAETAKSAQGNSATRSNKAQEQQKPQLAANPALNEKLGAMGASTGGGSDDNKAQSLGEIASAVKTMSETLETLKTTVSALAERKSK